MDENRLIKAVLNEIRKELDRLYWNKYQKEMNSPFDNTGETYSNNTFTVRAYYWGDNEEEASQPNFEYKDFCVYWYKHNNRGVEIVYGKPITAEFLSEMLDDCFDAMRKDFGES